MLIFEGWEDKEDIRRATSQDTVADLPTDEQRQVQVQVDDPCTQGSLATDVDGWR